MAESFAPTHTVPEDGLPAWAVPDPMRAPIARLGAHLPVQVFEQRPDGWAHVVCSNGWSGWLDGLRLVPATVQQLGPPNQQRSGTKLRGPQGGFIRLPRMQPAMAAAMGVSLFIVGMGVLLGLLLVSTSVGSAGGTAGIVGGSLLILLEAGFGACALIAAITGQSAARVILTVLGAIQLLGALIDALKEGTVAGVNPGIAISLFVIGLGLWWLPSTTEAMKAKQAQHRPH